MIYIIRHKDGRVVSRKLDNPYRESPYRPQTIEERYWYQLSGSDPYYFDYKPSIEHMTIYDSVSLPVHSCMVYSETQFYEFADKSQLYLEEIEIFNRKS